MKQRFKEGITPKSFIALLSVLTILFGIGAIFFFDFFTWPDLYPPIRLYLLM